MGSPIVRGHLSKSKYYVRREFLAVALGAAGTLLHGQPHQNFPSEPRKRLAVSSYPFRSFIVSRDKPGMTLEQFAASVPSRFGVTGIEPWSHHFRSTEPEYVSRVKQSFEQDGVHVVNIPVDIRANLCSGEASERKTAYTNYSKWIDAAVLLGPPSIRIHLPPPPVNANYMECTVAGLKRVAEYGRQKDIVVNLENDDPRTEDPFRIVDVITRVNSPFLRRLA
jgi:sugar phosphate isomerase/epimerase